MQITSHFETCTWITFSVCICVCVVLFSANLSQAICVNDANIFHADEEKENLSFQPSSLPPPPLSKVFSKQDY